MRTFDVTGCTAKIFRPGQPLAAWTAVQERKPFAVCNASLYSMSTREPCGTIYVAGQCIHNDGNGFGCGVTWHDATLAFGSPYDRAWRDYLTGYNSPVQNGEYVAPSWVDNYVFLNRLLRIGVGQRDGHTLIVTDDGVTLREFAEHAIAAGMDTLVNLDGGGSRHLLYDEKLIYQSPRIPYNAIAFYRDEEEQPEPEPVKPVCPYPEPTRNLLIGCKGDDVKWLQWNLNRLNYRCGAIDGIFGWNTWQAVWALQKTWSKVPDGICGPNTRRELLK